MVYCGLRLLRVVCVVQRGVGGFRVFWWVRVVYGGVGWLSVVEGGFGWFRVA